MGGVERGDHARSPGAIFETLNTAARSCREASRVTLQSAVCRQHALAKELFGTDSAVPRQLGRRPHAHCSSLGWFENVYAANAFLINGHGIRLGSRTVRAL